MAGINLNNPPQGGYSGFQRHAVPLPRWMLKRLSQTVSLAAPVKGWVSAANLANAGKQAALVMENFFPTQIGMRPRAGRTKKATIGTVQVERVFHYTGGNADKLFAADGTHIFDITSVADPTIAPSPSVSGQTSGYYSTALFTTSGAAYLIALNGTNLMLTYTAANGWVQVNGLDGYALPYDAETVNFTIGHTVTGGTSGATATILRDVDAGTAGTLEIQNVSGKTATITVTLATPGVVTWTAHGFSAGDSFIPTTTGALPTGMVAGTTYFVIATGLSTNTFEFAATASGAAINTSGSQSGTHTGTSTKLFLDNEALTTGGFGAATVNLPGNFSLAANIIAPAITGVATSALSAVWSYKDRLFFIEGGTLNAHYLPVDSIGGALGVRAFTGIFRRGGALLFGGTWSLDAGNGLDDKCVFVTDQGEMAVYSGANPDGSDPGDFDLVGRYDISIPMGKNVTMSAGGDLLVLTQDGVVPVSAATTKDEAALSLSAVSQQINPDWQANVIARGSTPWEIVKWPSHNLAVISWPRASATQMPYCAVVNIQTGAWCKYTNWDVRSLDVFRDGLYFGDEAGVIWNGEVGGSDDGSVYQCLYVGQAEHLNSMGVAKIIHSMRSVFTGSVAFDPQLSISTNYQIEVPSSPNPATPIGEGWDLSEWDVGVWDAASPPQLIQTQWVSIGQSGFAINPQLQIACSSSVAPDANLVVLDVLFEYGGVMV